MQLGMVSVIITTYGREIDLLMEAVNSVRSQTYKMIELIVVDDNGLESDIQKNNENFFATQEDIRYIPNHKNSGAQYSRNHGILESCGEYIAFLDDDDIWMPTKLEKQIALMKEKNAGVVFCNGLRFYNNDLNDTKLYQQLFISDEPVTYELELRGDRIGSTSHPLIRRDCLAKSGLFDIDMPARQDYEMWLRLCKYYEVWGINEPLFYYRYHSGDRITKSYKKEIKSYQLLWDKYKKDYMNDNIACAGIKLTMAITYLKGKCYVRAITWGLSALLKKPSYVFSMIKNHKEKKAMF